MSTELVYPKVRGISTVDTVTSLSLNLWESSGFELQEVIGEGGFSKSVRFSIVLLTNPVSFEPYTEYSEQWTTRLGW